MPKTKLVITKTYFLGVSILIHTIRSKPIYCDYKYLYSQMLFYKSSL